MEIIRLEFHGIGPFTEAHVINFRDLGHGGLFLLEGPTGSGKTTILDAIVFALYGDVAGIDSSKERIVSTMLKPDQEPFVDLIIDSSRGLLRVRRTPEYERPKLRGEGTTTNKAGIRLWKLSSPDDEAGSPISTNMAEASDELQQAIGLTKAQFTQTVMLPQGNFSTFLRAKPEDRRGVLQEIFGTELYDRFAEKLNEMAQDYRSQTALAEKGVCDVASSFCQVAWFDDAEAATEPIPEQVAFDAARDSIDLDALREGAQNRRTALDEDLAQALAAAESAGHRHLEAGRILQAIEARNQLIEEATILEQRHHELERREPQVEQDEARLAAAERAEYVRRPLRNVLTATQSLNEARETASSETEHLRTGTNADLADGEPSPDGLRSEQEAARLAAAQLERVVDLEKGLADRERDLEREHEDHLDQRSRIEEGRHKLDEQQNAAAELTDRLVFREAAAARIAETVEATSQATRRRDAAREHVRLAELLGTSREKEREQSDAYQSAVERHESARTAWLGSLASELASELAEGQPCPVCGSVAHPAPAAKDGGFISRGEVELLAERMDEASREATEARAKSDHIAQLIEEQGALTNGATLAAAEAALAEAQKRRAEATEAATEAAAIRQEIEGISQSVLDSERELAEAQQVLAAEVGRVDEKRRQLDMDQEAVKAQAAGFVSVHSRHVALTTRAEAARHLASCLTTLQTATAELTRSSSELSAVLDQMGFTSAEETRSALLDDPEREALRAALKAYRDEVAEVLAQLHGDHFAGLSGATPEDPSPARQAKEQAEAAEHKARDLAGMVRATVKAVARASKDLNSSIDAFVKVRDEAGPVLRMANLTNAGDGNLQHVTLPTYVVLRRFEEVVDLANVRLDAMTGGRYELRRTDEQEGRSRRRGLGLEVVDHQARDSARDPKTLSGGETFMASLSLALGLADAVTAEAGGIQLHTMFVDEGFGSLDSDTLDAVMQQLFALRAGGRSVGVVSHVAEMKQRITERVTVIPRHDGTSTLTCSIDA